MSFEIYPHWFPTIGVRELRRWKNKFRLGYKDFKIVCRVDPNHPTSRWKRKGKPPKWWGCNEGHKHRVGIDFATKSGLGRFLNSNSRRRLFPKEERIINEIERVLSKDDIQ